MIKNALHLFSSNEFKVFYVFMMILFVYKCLFLQTNIRNEKGNKILLLSKELHKDIVFDIFDVQTKQTMHIMTVNRWERTISLY